jgi:hypothetical protein
MCVLDPSFVSHGDRTISRMGWLGTCRKTGLLTMRVGDPVTLKEDLTDKDVPRSHQIVRQWREICEANNNNQLAFIG